MRQAAAAAPASTERPDRTEIGAGKPSGSAVRPRRQDATGDFTAGSTRVNRARGDRQDAGFCGTRAARGNEPAAPPVVPLLPGDEDLGSR